MTMNIKPIKSERDHRRALKEIERLMDARPNTAEGDRLDVLTTLIEAWEQKHHAIDAPDPVEAIHFAMEQRGVTRRDLEPLIGSRARVAEILNYKRPDAADDPPVARAPRHSRGNADPRAPLQPRGVSIPLVTPIAVLPRAC